MDLFWRHLCYQTVEVIDTCESDGSQGIGLSLRISYWEKEEVGACANQGRDLSLRKQFHTALTDYITTLKERLEQRQQRIKIGSVRVYADEYVDRLESKSVTGLMQEIYWVGKQKTILEWG